MKRIMVLFLSVVMLLSTVIMVCAAESTQDGIVVTLTTDRQKYEGEQVIRASVTVTNTNSFPVEDVTLEVIPPNGYAYSGPAGKQTLDILDAVGSWKQTDFELTVPEDVNSATMTIRMYNDANATGHIAYWDNITIIKAE